MLGDLCIFVFSQSVHLETLYESQNSYTVFFFFSFFTIVARFRIVSHCQIVADDVTTKVGFTLAT